MKKLRSFKKIQLIPFLILLALIKMACTPSEDLKESIQFRTDGSSQHFQFIEVDVFENAQTKLVLVSDSLHLKTVLVDSVFKNDQKVILSFSKNLKMAREKYPDKLLVEITDQISGYYTLWYYKNNEKTSLRFFNIP